MTRDDGWEESTEGDLDPDLTEEDGYGDWEPSRPPLSPTLLRLVALVLVIALLFPVLAVAIR